MSDITDAEARAALYGITDDQKVQAFGAYGIELDFAGGFYRKGHRIKATPSDIDGWSFSRGSVAVVDVEGAIQSFPQDVPRIVADLGLAIEPAAQNLLLRSQRFDHVKWDKINVGSGLAPVVVADDAPAPDGTMTADRISLSLDGGTGTGDRCHLQQDLAPVLDAKYGGSLFVKGVDGEKIIFRHVAGTDYLLHTFDGTWQRIEIVETATGTARFFEFGLRGGFGTSDTVSFHAWGGQIEAGDNITSYVPSGEFSATRDKDNAILDGLAFGTCTVLIDATLTTGAANSERGRRAFAVLYLGSGVDDNVTIVNNDAGGTGSVVTPEP